MQAHNGEATKGEYRVKLPDGRVQIVTYTADDGGYRADIRYDKGETSPGRSSTNNAPSHQHSFSSDQTSALNSDNNPEGLQPTAKDVADKKDSSLLYFNEIRTFSTPSTSKPATSYETVEHVDEEPYPYSRKLLEDVNYLLKYVTPTVETKTENVFDITPDSKVLKNRHFVEQKQAKENQKPRDAFRNIPQKLLELEKTKFGDPALSKLKFERLSFDSLPPFPNFNISSTFEPYAAREPVQLNNPKYGDSREYSQSSTPAYQPREQPQYVPRLEQRPPLQSPPQYHSHEQPYSSTVYDSRERSQFNEVNQPANSPALVPGPLYETKAPQLSTAGYDQADRPSQYETKAPQLSTTSYEARDQPALYETKAPQLSTTSYEARDRPALYETKAPHFSTSSYEARDRPALYETKAPQFSTASYEVRDRPVLYETKAPQLGPTSYEPRPSSGTPKYESRTPQYNIAGQVPRIAPSLAPTRYETQIPPRYQSNEQTNSGQLYDSRERLSPVKYETERYEPSPYIPPRYTARPLAPTDGRYNQIEVSVYHVPKFESLENLPANVLREEQLHFIPTSPRYNPQDFAPTLPAPKHTPQYGSVSPVVKNQPPSKYHDVSAKFNSQEQPPVSAVPNYNSQEHPPVGAAPRFNPKDYPPVAAVPPKFDSQELGGVTPSTPLFTPTTPTNEGGRPAHDHQFGKIEIPQYLHIHRYEDSGENAKPKELIYYTPLQIPIPNSIAYLEQGSQNASDGHRATFTPSFITMTEHPRVQNGHPFREVVPEYPRRYEIANISSKFVSDVPLVGKLKSDYDAPHPPTQQTNVRNDDFEPSPVQPPSTNEKPSEDEHPPGHNEGNMLSDFDARIYSGYFDFIPPSEVESEKEASNEYRHPSKEQTSAEKGPPSSSLPQYYYDFSTASPTHRYINSEVGSQELNTISDDDHLRNSSFRTSAYLRPLRKERVYIHHNAMPTAPSDNQVTVGSESATKSSYKDADVSIVKSISSTIPPELLKDFDVQLRSSIFRGDSFDAANEMKETRATSPMTHSPKLNEVIAKKLQATIPAIGKVYLKAPTTKRTVRWVGISPGTVSFDVS